MSALAAALAPGTASAQPVGGFKHIIVVVQENRTPDNLFGSNPRFEPGVDIAKQNGFANRMFQTNQGPSFPAHQFLFGGTSAPTADTTLFAAENLPKHTPAGCVAPSKTRVALIDALGSETSHPAIYPCFEHQTLADLLDAAPTPIGWRYYSSGANAIWTAPNAIAHICDPATVGGTLQCTGADWVNDVIANDPARILTDIGNCALQPVSWVIPTGEESDHAGVNNGSGPSWVASIVNAIGGARTCAGESYWQNTAIFITWDDWGGWFDHVPPFKIAKPNQWGSGYTYGFRVPLLVVSAYTKPGQVSDQIFDSGSILAFIEKNFGLGFIGPGTDRYTRYADYQATLPGRGDLASFFTLTTPKAFAAVQSKLSIEDLLHAPKSVVGPDDD